MVVAGGGKKFSPVCKNNRNPVCRSNDDPGVWNRSFLGWTHSFPHRGSWARGGLETAQGCRGSPAGALLTVPGAVASCGRHGQWAQQCGVGVDRVSLQALQGRGSPSRPRPLGAGFLFPFCSSPIFRPPPHGQARNVRSQQQARDCRHLHSTISVTVTLEIR